MKNLTLTQLKKWRPCGDWVARFEKEVGKSTTWDVVLAMLIKEEKWSDLNWLTGKRLEQLTKRQVCAFSYRCSHRALKYARKQDLEVLEKAISFAKVFAKTGKVDKSAARSAAWSVAWSVARSARSAESAESAARSAEYKWQWEQLLEIEENFKKVLKTL